MKSEHQNVTKARTVLSLLLIKILSSREKLVREHLFFPLRSSQVHRSLHVLVRVGTEVFEITLEKIEFAVSRQEIVSGER